MATKQAKTRRKFTDKERAELKKKYGDKPKIKNAALTSDDKPISAVEKKHRAEALRRAKERENDEGTERGYKKFYSKKKGK